MTTREALHRYLDDLPDELLEAANQVLKRAFDNPVIRSLHAAPYDDEPLTEEDEQAVDAARRAVAAGETVSHDELRRLLFEE
jgi:hypothetical protein